MLVDEGAREAMRVHGGPLESIKRLRVVMSAQ